MKRDFELRRIDSPDYERHQTVTRWRRNGHEVRLDRPAKDLRYITFWAQGSQGLWQGVVQPQDWLANVLPQLSALLPAGATDGDALELFSAVARPVEINEELLDYDRLFEFSLVESCDLGCFDLPALPTAQCTLWLLVAPNQACASSPFIQSWLERLPLTLRCSLGSSFLNPSQLSGLAQGDVLCITEHVNQLVLADRYVGSFTIVKEGLLMHHETDPAGSLLLSSALAEVPVKLEFVLEERTVTLIELNELMSGSVLTLDSDAVQAVEVRVGGRTIAVGELIQMGNRLGVELREVYWGLAP